MTSVVTRQSLSEQFQWLNDHELLSRFRSGELTELAKSVAGEELQRRGLDVSQSAVEPATEHKDVVADDDLVAIARVSTPAEAEMLRGRLEVEGVPAIVADAHTVQALALMALVVGGVRVLVPASYADRALEIVRGVERGDYVLRNESGATRIAQNRKSPSSGRSQTEKIWEGICVFFAVGFGSAVVILIVGYQLFRLGNSYHVCGELDGYCAELVVGLAISSFFLLGSYVAIRVATAEDAKTPDDDRPGATY